MYLWVFRGSISTFFACIAFYAGGCFSYLSTGLWISVQVYIPKGNFSTSHFMPPAAAKEKGFWERPLITSPPVRRARQEAAIGGVCGDTRHGKGLRPMHPESLGKGLRPLHSC